MDDADLFQEWRQQKIDPLPTIKDQRGNDWIAKEQSHHQKESAVPDARQNRNCDVPKEMVHAWPIKKQPRTLCVIMREENQEHTNYGYGRKQDNRG